MVQQRATIETVLNGLLSRFQSTSAGISGAAIVDNDGFIMAANLPQDADERRIAGIGAALVALGEQVIGELQHGALERAFIEGTGGYVTAMSLGQEAVLVAIARREAKPGLVFLQMERVAIDIRRVMKL